MRTPARFALFAAGCWLLVGCDLVSTSNDPTPADFEEWSKPNEPAITDSARSPLKKDEGEPCTSASECASNACIDVALLHHAVGGRCARSL